jgi:hypothetical protein
MNSLREMYKASPGPVATVGAQLLVAAGLGVTALLIV